MDRGAWQAIAHGITRVGQDLANKPPSWKKSYEQPKHIKKQRYYFANKDLSSESYGFSSSHVWMWELSPLNCKETQPVNPKGDQSWILIGRTDGEAEAPILWLPDAKNWLIGKDPDTGND